MKSDGMGYLLANSKVKLYVVKVPVSVSWIPYFRVTLWKQ